MASVGDRLDAGVDLFRPDRGREILGNANAPVYTACGGNDVQGVRPPSRCRLPACLDTSYRAVITSVHPRAGEATVSSEARRGLVRTIDPDPPELLQGGER